ncbi:hypothetical protein H5410_002126 [Solanum commersonii]|uniref:Uncharacterized protein n=1 Tax=Solanum commersonii TaxID=4109 RepID=A0A9J6B137_SOLCO|nr:hypothetical protein H5410_002126 [Solanum commersonii]
MNLGSKISPNKHMEGQKLTIKLQGKSNGFEALEDLHKELEAWNEKENKRILIYKVMHPGSKIAPDKHMEERKAGNKVAGRGSCRIIQKKKGECLNSKLSWKNSQRDYVEGKSNGFEALEDLHKDLEARNEKENKRILIYKVIYPASERPPDKHMEEQKRATKLRVGKVLEETKNVTLIKHFKFDLNVAHVPEKEESS